MLRVTEQLESNKTVGDIFFSTKYTIQMYFLFRIEYDMT